MELPGDSEYKELDLYGFGGLMHDHYLAFMHESHCGPYCMYRIDTVVVPPTHTHSA